MPSRPLPRIRIDLLDGPLPRDLSPSTSLDIRDVLGRAILSPLLTEDFKFDDANDVLFFDKGYFQDVPPFPHGHRPPLFIVNSHRAQLPFPLRPEVFELADFYTGERDGSLLLSAPTLPRMKLMVMEQLYVQTWVDTLTFDNPPKHIPWTSDTPSPEKKWISEGSIFPAKLIKSSAERQRYIRGGPGDNKSHEMQVLRCGASDGSRDSRKRKVSSPTDGRAGSHTLTSPILAKPADLGTKLPRMEMKKAGAALSQAPRRRIASTPLPLPLPRASPPTVTPNRTTRAKPIASFSAPLAARRGKTLNDLKLKGSLIEDLEYPDIPTAFRGSPSVWSPQFDVRLATPSITTHRDMLSDLKSKSAALGNSPSIFAREQSEENGRWPETETTSVSLAADEWTSQSGLNSFERTLQGSSDEFAHVRRDIIADTSTFLPRDFSTPVKGPRPRLEPYRPLSAPTPQSPHAASDGPPSAPLPPRPALANPSTPPHVKGILKKAKSVRFEDVVVKEPPNRPSSTAPPATEPVLKPFSPLRQTTIISPQRPCTPTPGELNTPKGPAKKRDIDPISPGLEKHASEKKPTPRPRLTPRRVKSGGDVSSLRPEDGNAPEPPFALPLKSPPTASSVDRPCRIAHVKDNASPITSELAQGKQQGSPVTATDVRRRIEGTPTKHRISTPLRNIFRFK